MRSLRYGALGVLAVASGLIGQMSSPKYDTTEDRSADGKREEVFSNRYAYPVVALHASTECLPFSGEMDVDNLLYNQPRWHIKPGSSYKFLAAGVPDGCPFKVDAVLFADGSTAGDPKAIQGIFDHRRGVQEELALLRPILSQAVQGELDEPSLLKFITERESAIAGGPHTNLPEERGRRAAIATLKRQITVHDDSGSGSQFAASDFASRSRIGLGFVDDWATRLAAAPQKY